MLDVMKSKIKLMVIPVWVHTAILNLFEIYILGCLKE